MKHSTNYTNTFIAAAEDCPVNEAEIPPVKGDKKTVANHQFEMLFEQPYQHTSDDVLFTVHAIRKEIPENEWPEAREVFFSKGQPCFRASPLTKRYGWGLHSDARGKIALIAKGDAAYDDMINDASLQHTQAMRNKRK